MVTGEILEELEWSWFAERTNLSANTPLADLKTKYFASLGYAGLLDEMEKQWLVDLAGDSKSSSLDDVDLWVQACVEYKVDPVKGSIIDNKKNFYKQVEGNPSLPAYIKSLPGLVAYWRMNELSGTNVIDYSPNGLDGTNSGATVGQAGQIGRAYSFDGTNDLVTIAANTLPAWTGESTLGFIMKVNVAPSSDTPVIDSQWGDDGGGGWQIIVDGNGTLVSCYVGDKTNRDVVSGGLTDMTDGFHFVVITKHVSNDRQRVYVDGSIVNTATTLSFGTTEPDTDRKLQFGANHPEDAFLSCTLQHIFISSLELSTTQVLKLAQIARLA